MPSGPERDDFQRAPRGRRPPPGSASAATCSSTVSSPTTGLPASTRLRLQLLVDALLRRAASRPARRAASQAIPPGTRAASGAPRNRASRPPRSCSPSASFCSAVKPASKVSPSGSWATARASPPARAAFLRHQLRRSPAPRTLATLANASATAGLKATSSRGSGTCIVPNSQEGASPSFSIFQNRPVLFGIASKSASASCQISGRSRSISAQHRLARARGECAGGVREQAEREEEGRCDSHVVIIAQAG